MFRCCFSILMWGGIIYDEKVFDDRYIFKNLSLLDRRQIKCHQTVVLEY